jgi:hypothetical protein
MRLVAGEANYRVSVASMIEGTKFEEFTKGAPVSTLFHRLAGRFRWIYLAQRSQQKNKVAVGHGLQCRPDQIPSLDVSFRDPSIGFG